MSARRQDQPREATLNQEEEVYRSLTPTSSAYFEEGSRYLPGADSRTPLFYAPYPAVFESARGAELVDVDGNRLLDFTSNHSSLILGNGHPRVLEAVARQIDAGTSFPGPTTPQIRLARQLCERIPSFERVRFTNSGTEATLQAARAARAFTGRTRYAKIEGGYNGTADVFLVSTSPTADQIGAAARPAAVAASEGLAPGSAESVVVLPFNDVAAARALLEEHGEQLAAVMVEPVMGAAGMIPAEPEYLQMLRDVTRRLGILLIFDEVISFRVAYGGAQAHYDVTPDLTCLGKAIGGGFPLGVVGGRADVMALFDPSQGRRPAIPHPGSFNANPVSLVAGSTVLEVLTEDTVATLNERGEQLRGRLRDALAAVELDAQVTGLGSLFAIHFAPRPVRSYRDMLAGDPALRHRLFLGLYNEGVLVDPRGVGCLSVATGEAEIDRFVEVFRTAAGRIAGRDLSRTRADVAAGYRLRCAACSATYEDDGYRLACDAVHGPSLLVTRYDAARFEPDDGLDGLFRYAAWLPARRAARGAGRTVTYRSDALSQATGLEQVWVAFNGFWPERGARLETGTFKELEAWTVLSRLPAGDDTVLVIASAGNTGAAFARIASRGEVPCLIIVPAPALAGFAFSEPVGPRVRIVSLEDGADYADAIELAERVAAQAGFVAEGGVRNVGRRDGLATAFLDAVETLGRLPDCYFQAVGSGAGAIAAHEAAGRLLADGRFGAVTPRLMLSQNAPFTPIHDAWRAGGRELLEVAEPQAKALGAQLLAQVLSNPRPPYPTAGGVYDALCASDGDVYRVDNAELTRTAAWFEAEEGIDVDPAAAVAVASLLAAARAGDVPQDALVVVNVTGGGRRRYMETMPVVRPEPALRVRAAELGDPATPGRVAGLFDGRPSPSAAAADGPRR